VQRKIFGPKREAVTLERRRLLNEELYALSSSPDIIRVMKSIRMGWARLVKRMRDRRAADRVLMRRPGGKIPFGISVRRWEDMYWINLA
jgi:hypothetical protein